MRTFKKAIIILAIGAIFFFIGAFAGIRFERARSATQEAEAITALHAQVDSLKQRLHARGAVRSRQEDWEEMQARLERLKVEHPEKYAQMQQRRKHGLTVIRPEK